ncbi:M96 mating-specific protein family [Phytophthora cinnamomi]|uniref:M96 mating-specific protein family n=1 Tax=Phytophthora cinnamomi TaxID=4785 RepID=UPI00355995FC|nr:M96 mating-specific protein family [Phytophthora cinnamomi]
MSAVDDVAARIRRLEEARQAKTAQLRQLQRELRYNALTGVDERLDCGLSAARLDVKVEAGRNLLFKAGFLSGQRAYVRVTAEVVAPTADSAQLQSTTVMEQKCTSKRPVGYTPRWNEALAFQGLPAAVGTLRVDVMQEERIGADEVLGSVVIPLASLQDQRRLQRWHVLQKHDKDTISEILFSCRFQRSPISALELELELLQNQANELHLFVGRHQNLVGVAAPDSRSSFSAPKLLQGKEVVPEQTPERTASTRFSAVASFPPSMRKRECVENNSTCVNVEMHEAPRVKRQRVVDTEKQVNSLSDRIANWLLPAPASNATASAASVEATPQTGAFSGEAAGTTTSQFFPFKQRQTTPGLRRPRRTGRPVSTTPQKTPSALQAIEKWLFTDKDGNPRDLPFGRQAPSY